MGSTNRLTNGAKSRATTARLALLAGLVAAFASSVVTVPAARAAEPECANEAIRVQQGATFLSECRAYELVSPGSDPYVSSNNYLADHGVRAALDGESVSYFSYYPAEGATTSGYYYLARRGEDGWSIEAQAPQDTAAASSQLQCEQSLYFSSELTASVLGDGWNDQEERSNEAPCSSSVEPLASGAPTGYGNLFVREGEGGYALVNTTPEGVTPGNAELEDATPSFSSILFEENGQLTPEAPAGFDLYENVSGVVQLVSVLPEGKAVNGELAGGHERFEHTNAAEDNTADGQASWAHAVSEDGQRVVFYAEGNLYLRENATQSQSALSGETCTEASKACTIEIDASQGPGASGGGIFWYASADGSRVFFADESKLTGNSNATSKKPDLYEYDVETGQLTDLTPGTSAEPGDARGFSGGSEDGSYVYFVAESDLTTEQENEYGASAQHRKPNLYLYHEGATTFIATLEASTGASAIGDIGDWQENSVGVQNDGDLHARVSPGGGYLAFESVGEPTGFDNAPAASGDCNNAERSSTASSCDEIFLYDAAANSLACASCGTKAPTGDAELPEATLSTFQSYGGPAYLSRNLLEDGRLFFTTPVSLVTQDENGADDVYEYDEGTVRLISTATSATGAVFEDASANGQNVFFVTAQALVSADTNNGDSIYDARVDGGFAAPASEPAAGETCNSDEACRAPLSEAPAEAFGASSALSGPGDLVPSEATLKEPATTGGGKHKPKPKPTRAQKLKHALKLCAKTPKRRRAACRTRARKRFGNKARKHGQKHSTRGVQQ